MTAKRTTPRKATTAPAPPASRQPAAKKPASQPSSKRPRSSAKPSNGKTASTLAKARPKPQPATPSDATFPIVAIGASAGGLEAFTQLLRALPTDTGMAFVLVQHLDPRHPSQLRDLLSRATSMPVVEVTEQLPAQPNHVYVISPNTHLGLAGATLKPSPRSEGPRPIAIDLFFEALAQEHGRRAIGVVLSGTGSDGTVGLRAIKAEGGITFAQDEQSALFDAMPHSAITAGVVDFSLPPAGIAKELARLGQHPYVSQIAKPPAPPLEPTMERDDATLHREIQALLKSATGVDLTSYKQTTFQRRIARRMALAQCDTLAAYTDRLQVDQAEVQALYEDVFIHVTSFFREAGNYELLQQQVFPALLKARTSDAPVRIWVAGCSSGEEAYSIAIAWLDFTASLGHKVPVQVFATDISPAAITKARAGRYADTIEDHLTPARLQRYFVKGAGGYHIGKAVRDICVFAPQHLIHDPPFTQMDLISCCNVLIYLEPEFQKYLIPRFHYALKPHGFLILGASESIGKFTNLFSLLKKQHSVYARKAAVSQPPFHFRAQNVRPPPAGAAAPALAAGPDRYRGMTEAADRLALAQYAPASVIVRGDLEVLQVRGQVGPFLEVAAGLPSHNLRKLARRGLEVALPALVHKARRTHKPARQENLPVSFNGRERLVNVAVVLLPATPEAPEAPEASEELYLVSFEEVPHSALPKSKSKRRPPPAQGAAHLRLARLEAELEQTRASLQTVTIERDRDNEELTAALEELQSGNEELQSTNEELQSAKEELQSSNEEMTTLNEELEGRTREATQALSDLNNLTDSVHIPMVLVSGDLQLRFFTPIASQVLNVVATDVGRPIGAIKARFNLPDLAGLVAQVTDSRMPLEYEVQDQEGRWYVMRLRPYVGVDHKIDGAVISWLEITAMKAHQVLLAQARDFSAAVVETVRDPMLVLDGQLRVQLVNPAYCEVFQVTPATTQGRLLYELGDGQWDLPPLRALLAQIVPEQAQFNDFEVEHDFVNLGRRTMLLNARRIAGAEAGSGLILLAVQDITERKQLERLQSEQRRVLELVAQRAPLTEVLESICRVVEEQAGREVLVSILLVDDSGQHLQHGGAPSLPDSFKQATEGLPIGLASGSAGAAVFWEKAVGAADIAIDPYWVDHQAVALAHGLRACWSVPISTLGSKVLGTITLYYRDARLPSTHEQRIVGPLARLASIAIERHQSDLTLRAAQQRSATILESIGDAFYALDRQWRFTYLNNEAVRLVGRPREALVGKDLWEEFPDAVNSEMDQAYRRALAEELPVSFEWYYPAWEGWFEVHVYPSAEGLSVYFQNITERKQTEVGRERYAAELEERVVGRTTELQAAHDQLRRLTAYLQAAREEERGRIAHNIHDELGQSLSGLKMGLSALRRSLKEPPLALVDRLQQLSGEVDAIIATVRQVAQELRPSLLDDLGLLPAIEWQVTEFQKRSGLHCQLNTQLEEIHLGPDRAIAVFRVFQELLTNVFRHAQATNITVALDEQDHHLCLSVSDNGRGITVAQTRGKGSMGLLGLRERLRPYEGTVEFTSVPDQGTTVTVTIPLTGP